MGFIYDSTSSSRIAIGEIDADGYVYNSISSALSISRMPIGQVDKDGYVYDSISSALSISRMPIGQVDKDGYVYNSTSSTRIAIGQVDNDGYVYNSTSSSRFPIGQADGPYCFAGGAALLLLLNKTQYTETSQTSESHVDNANNNKKGNIPIPGCLMPILCIVGFFLIIGVLWLYVANRLLFLGIFFILVLGGLLSWIINIIKKITRKK